MTEEQKKALFQMYVELMEKYEQSEMENLTRIYNFENGIPEGERESLFAEENEMMQDFTRVLWGEGEENENKGCCSV